MTYFCYIDESGTPELPGTSTHFVLVGVAIPIGKWDEADSAISAVLHRYDLVSAEIHTAWMLRKYPEQIKIANFEKLNWEQRKSAVDRYRAGELIRLQKTNHKAHRQAKKNFAHTAAYVHLSYDERKKLIEDIAEVFSKWDFAFLFAEAIDKLHMDPQKTGRSVSEQAFEQLVTRFETFLAKDCPSECLGVLIHDNNETVARKHTELMRHFHKDGTLWSSIGRIAETPLFVDSRLTRMVQVADLCSYAIRRYVENSEEALFGKIFKRAHSFNGKAVGVRHFTGSCECGICKNHRNAKAFRRRPRNQTAAKPPTAKRVNPAQ
ncbi:DUF3800 domain-containing protein [Sphingopyxis sp. XHP0097]|uniref:DUF3800 domain-containing protein n=1 Tax=Sphingopyxis jiangsuensis TaxID=2871171 RepID=A0ABS7MG87_9SPHN|nr:DUF3800 domain-containing protein [Sphingopyxis jiangsuensis]MBY4638032.1 DUF3800 domain-containing protein [Sphingopyxis jiangsuensis]